MASSRFSRLLAQRLAIASTGIGAVGFAVNNPVGRVTAAEEQFHVSSKNPVPDSWKGRIWQIRNDYPIPSEQVSIQRERGTDLPVAPGPELPIAGRGLQQEAPWLSIDFEKDPEKYCQVIKEYCWEGNVNNEFVVQKNKIRDWYHAPWMHYSDSGREPLNGLTWERPTPPYEFAKTQGRYLQTWACSYFNFLGASLLGKVWQDPSKPEWKENLKFPLGTCIFKILLTDATDEELPNLKDSPIMNAVIARPSNDPTKEAASPKKRNNFSSELRLLQVDFAVRDDRAPIGWIFGTFMYTGEECEKNAWDRIIPVGILWGNDPTLNQAAFENGSKPAESWINPDAEELRVSLKGARPSWGWNGRMNGPADNFISSCASCHSLSQTTGEQRMTQPIPKHVGDKYIPVNDRETMKWFRNIPAGQPFTPDTPSGDYSLQLMIGFHNYHHWIRSQKRKVWGLKDQTKYIIPEDESLGVVEKREGLRQGPDMHYDPPE